jgi:flagellar protein FliL
MSVAVAEPASAAPSRGRKKLIVVSVVLALLLAAGAGGAVWFVKKKRADAEAAAAADEAGPDAAGHGPAKLANAAPPSFLPLEHFIVNLADRDSERFAQIGITLELDNAQVADQIKAYMPAIRNGILMVLATKTSKELLTRPGKEQLAMEIMHESVRPLGVELEGEDGDKKGRTPLEQSPVRHVHFSSFIIQ